MPLTPPDRLAHLRAPAQWQAVEFISDLHLHAADPVTFEGWSRWMDRPVARRADALFILGDLFEVWIGDDLLGGCRAWGVESENRAQRGQFSPDLPRHSPARGQKDGEKWTAALDLQPTNPKADSLLEPAPSRTDDSDRPFWRACADQLRAYSAHTAVFFMPGNRDFLLGPGGLQRCGMTGLNDPTALHFLGRPWLLSHGDALCLDDTDYMRFRHTVRQPAWAHDFLAKPLAEREALARNLRQQSEARKRSNGHDPSLWADVDAAAARAWLQQANADTLIHGHTHRPARHDLGGGLQRVVLSDWDLTAQPPRAQILRLDRDGLRRFALADDA